MAHLFLSHSSADAAGAKVVAQLLRNAGFEVWLDLDQLMPGDNWAKMLESALEDSSHFVVLVGETGVQRWVDREVRFAIDRNTKDPNYRVIPLLGPGANEKALPLFLQQHQYLKLDWRQPETATIQKIASAILEAPPERVSVLPPGVSPFRGLLTFDSEHSLLFFGRDREVDELLERMETARFLPVVGDSGSGKSSLVRAGLIPALLRGRAGMVDWRIATMKPGEDPLDSLAEAVPQFVPALDAGERLRLIGEAKKRLHDEEGADGLSEILAALNLPASSRQLLIIDQFEQLFTGRKQEISADGKVAQLVNIILRGADRKHSTLQVIITLRADFFGLCHPYPDLWRLLTSNHYSVRRMEPDSLREAIVQPMALAGVHLDPGLADTLIEEAGTQPGSLALLEHALDQLWRESEGEPPTSAHYNKIGRLKGAIRKHADWVLEKKLESKRQREMARRIFVELTALGEGTEDSARRVPKTRLLSLPGDGAEEVLQVLTDERLVTAGAEDGQEMVSIAHEALIREWDTLQDWLRGRRQDIRLQRELTQAEEAWRKDSDSLWRGGRLEQAIRWKQQNPGEVRPEIDRFIRRSRNRRRRDSVLRWGSVLLVIGLLFALALPTIEDKLAYMPALLAETRVNPQDGLRYVRIEPGEFQMGCSEKGCDADETPHLVRIIKEFWIGQTEVTRVAYAKVMKGPIPDPGDSDLPATGVSWDNAVRYCRELRMELPTEAQWEYAARAGSKGERYGDLGKIAVFSVGEPAKVGSKWPNDWGLYDTLGNAWEWTNDWYDENYYKTSPVDDPPGPPDTGLKVMRGGSWVINPVYIRVSYRVGVGPASPDFNFGFRCAGELP